MTLVCYVLIFSFISFILSDALDIKRFEEFKTLHGKNYDDEENKIRLEIFNNNIELITKKNSEGLPYTLNVNKFADLTLHEFKAKYLRRTAPNLNEINYKSVANFETPNLASSEDVKIDWSEEMNVVKDQGQCGSCWSFASVGSVESCFKLKYNFTILLSEQEIVDCTYKRPFYMQGCDGGLGFVGMDYMQSRGVSRSAEYNYTGTLKSCTAAGKPKPVIINSYQSCSDPWDFDANCTFSDWINLFSQGPMDVCIAANDDFMFYESGVYVGNCVDDYQLNHEVVAVAYDPVTKTGLFKNQWGTDWGQDGYFNISIDPSKGYQYSCGIARNGFLPDVNVNQNCAILYDSTNYEKNGKTTVLCYNDPFDNRTNLALITDSIEDKIGFSKIISSIRLGPKTTITLFTEPNFSGEFLIVDADIKDLYVSNPTFDNAIQSIYFGSAKSDDFCIKIYNKINTTDSETVEHTVCFKDTKFHAIYKKYGFYVIVNNLNNKVVRVELGKKIADVTFYDSAYPDTHSRILKKFTKNGNLSNSSKNKASSFIITLK